MPKGDGERFCWQIMLRQKFIGALQPLQRQSFYENAFISMFGAANVTSA